MSELALSLIAENQRTQDKFLDLGNCGLTEIPAEIGQLTWLESLSLASDWYFWEQTEWQRRTSRNTGDRNKEVTSLAPLAKLKGLKYLYAAKTSVKDLRPLSGLIELRALDLGDTQINDLAPLALLTKLEKLDMSGTQTASFVPLAGITGLRRLEASDTHVADLAPLKSLQQLGLLDIARTSVIDLGVLENLTNLVALYVSNTKVKDLRPLRNLVTLQTLHIIDTAVTDVSPLVEMAALQSLELSYTDITDLRPLAGLKALRKVGMSHGKVTDLGPLAGLTTLEDVDVGASEVSDLSPLAGLPELRELDASQTAVADVTPLAGLSNLRHVNLAGARVESVQPLAKLAGLEGLELSGTLVTDVSPAAGLLNLRFLGFASTGVKDLSPLLALMEAGLPVRWGSMRENEVPQDGIYVENCPLTNPPPEIAKQGNEAVLNYFREREEGDLDHLREAKMLVLGEGGAGKTSLIRRLYDPGEPLPTEAETTKGISISPVSFRMKDGRLFRLNVWDFGGQQIYHATHQFFLTHRSLYVVVDDTRKDYKSVSDEGFRYWFDLIDVFGGHSPTLMFQNEKDGRSKAIDIGGIKQRYDNVRELYKGDLSDAHAVDEVRDGIEFYASHLDHIGEELPARWIKVRADIEARAKQAPYIPLQEYFDIYKRYMDFDRSKALLLSRYLHDLGVFLHFQDDALLARTVILQNEWATKAVFRILDDETVKAERGRFTENDCQRLWPDECYLDMHPELLALMQRFELCYELRDSQPKTWLAPQLLLPAKPEELKDWGKPEDMVLRYRYDFLPRGMISRMTVRQHRFVDNPDLAWVTGVLFERDDTQVLMEVLPSGNEIELRARGPESKGLLSTISADLDALNDSFTGLRDKVEKRIPCSCSECKAETVPEFFGEKRLLQRKKDGKLRVECPRSYEDVSVLELLDGIKPEKPADAGKSTPATAGTTRRVRIFLASSEEMREDRDKFEEYFRQQNDRLLNERTYLEIIRWEHFLDAMSETRLQDEYNKAIRACDVFVSLFFTKTGKFTEEEFDVAQVQFKKTGRPLIYTYFKKASVDIDTLPLKDINSLRAFQEKLTNLGHYYTKYDSADSLKLKFRDQIDMILDKFEE